MKTTRRTFSANLPTWLHALAQAKAKSLGLTFAEFCAHLLRERLRKEAVS